MKIIDMHAHAFPDKIAEDTLDKISKGIGSYKPHTVGTIKVLLSSMDKGNIKSSCILNIATKPGHEVAISKWSKEISSERIIPLGSIHPDSALNVDKILTEYKKEGILGVKLHPMYQKFLINDKKMYPIYESLSYYGMFVLFHAGFDMGYPGDKSASADKISDILEDFPRLKIIAAHMGGWNTWDDTLEKLCGKNIYLESSFIKEIPLDLLKQIFSKHDKYKFIFGSDSPWLDQKEQVDYINSLNFIEPNEKELLFYRNALNLLGYK